MSAQLRYMQRLAGYPIFVREGRRAVLTEAGRSLYRFAKVILGTTEALKRDLDDLAIGATVHFVVVGAPAYGTYVLPRLVSRFQREHPQLRVSLAIGPSQEVIDRVRVGRGPSAWSSRAGCPKRCSRISSCPSCASTRSSWSSQRTRSSLAGHL